MLSRPYKLIILSTVLLFLSACSNDEAPAAKATPVLATSVTLEDVPLHIESIGNLNASTYVAIFPQVSGQLLECCARDGSMVHKDDVLFKIDAQPYQIALREAKAQFILDQAAMVTSQKKLARYESLAKKDLISQQEWDELSAHVTAAKAILEQDAARLQAAKRNFSFCTITAPVSGRLGSSSLDAGNLVNAEQTTPLTSISVLNPISVKFTLTEKEFTQLIHSPEKREHFPIEMCSLCRSAIATGEVTFIDHNFNSQTGLIQLSGKFPNYDKLFLPGQSVRIKIPVTTLSNAKVIPARAVKINQIGPYAFVIKADNTIELRQLTLGHEFDGKVIVNQGLQKDERVVTEGHNRLFPGILVEVKAE